MVTEGTSWGTGEHILHILVACTSSVENLRYLLCCGETREHWKPRFLKYPGIRNNDGLAHQQEHARVQFRLFKGLQDAVNPPLRRVKQAEDTLPYRMASDSLVPESLGGFSFPVYKDCTNLLYFNSQFLPNKKIKKK